MMLNDAFVQDVLKLMLGAGITGLAVPWVLKRVDDNKHRSQKTFEADLARQGKLLEAQSALLDEITRIVWAWRYLAKQVVYYGSRGDRDHFDPARAKYEHDVWGLLDNLRTQISKARRLVSERAFERLNALYDYIVHDVDMRVSQAASQAPLDLAACAELSARFSHEVSARLDDAVFELARELRLATER